MAAPASAALEAAHEVIEGLASSKRLAELEAELESVPGGGAAIARLLRAAVRGAVAGASGSTSGRGASAAEGPRLATAVQEAVWEKLHSGSWHEVPAVWRDAYAAACLVAAVGALTPLGAAQPAPAAPGISGPGSREEAAPSGEPPPPGPAPALAAGLRELDLAAMMGGRLLRPEVDALTECLQEHWWLLHRQQEGTAPLPAAPVAGSAAPAAPLPPGSLGPQGTPIAAEELPSLESFWRDYMAGGGGGEEGTPLVISGAMQDWPALARWADPGYLLAAAGPRTVPVELGRHYLAEGWGQRLMTLEAFIRRHLSATSAPAAPPAGEAASGEAASGEAPAVGYLAQHPLFEQVPRLAADIREPEYCVLGRGEVQSVNAWLGPAGTVTPLHTDPHSNLLCQVVGRKYVRLYRPGLTPSLYPHLDGMHTNTSRVDLDAPDAEAFPAFSAAPWADAVLEPGQMLYIPPGWWHYVKSLSPSFSVSFWWR